jgi:hypothetical protein
MSETQPELPPSALAIFLGGLIAAVVGGASSLFLGASVIGVVVALAGTAVVIISAVRILAVQRSRSPRPMMDS